MEAGSISSNVIEKSGIAVISCSEKAGVWIAGTAWMALALNKASNRVKPAIASQPLTESQRLIAS
jgi:hypothetical protein